MVFEAGEVMEAHVPAAAVVGVVTAEGVEQRTHGHVENVARAGGVDLQLGAIGPHADDATAAVLELLAIDAFGFHKSEVAARDVEPAVNAQREAVRGVVRRAVFETEGDVLYQHLLLLGDTIAVLINERAEVRRMHEIEPVVIPHRAARAVHIGNEDLAFIGAAIAVGIAQADDAPAVWGAVDAAVLVRGNVERAVRRGGDIDRVVHHRRRGEKSDVELRGDFDFAEDVLFRRSGGGAGDGGEEEEFQHRRKDCYGAPSRGLSP